ncbi:MAG: hypothetical protein IT515_07215 [Burkholderiales bacterium]|nr:hypothetical protein [Burkholderiales bacterium]
MDAAPTVLDGAHAAFIQGGVSVIVASRDAHNTPTLVRALACRVSPDRRRVTVFLSASQAAALVAALRAIGAIAVVFSQPSTHRTIQLKGRDAAFTPLAPDDRERMTEQIALLVAELTALGHPEGMVRAFLDFAPDDVVAVAFTPAEAYAQTPGPGAGERLRR